MVAFVGLPVTVATAICTSPTPDSSRPKCTAWAVAPSTSTFVHGTVDVPFNCSASLIVMLLSGQKADLHVGGDLRPNWLALGSGRNRGG